MKTILLALSALTLITAAHADQAATLTCKGANVTLSVKGTYLGENSPQAQDLYVLSTNNGDESAYTAYFLNVEHDVGKFGVIYISGKNEVGGTFQLVTSGLKDASDDVSIRYTSEGTLTYNHGPLKGKEKVSCVTE